MLMRDVQKSERLRRPCCVLLLQLRGIISYGVTTREVHRALAAYSRTRNLYYKEVARVPTCLISKISAPRI
eukprot:1424407-Pleurochrysis_carterae.AAC.1